MTDAEKRSLLAKAVARLKRTKKGYSKDGGHWKAALALLGKLDKSLRPPAVPALGPLFKGGESVLLLSLTHQTSGLPLYPACDTAWEGGIEILAPEGGRVTRRSGGESGGYSVYLAGHSGLRYYFTHLNQERARIGPIAKGGRIGTVGSPSQFPAQRIAHVHFGVNIEHLVGNGKQLKWGRNGNGPEYTTGAPAIGTQLRKLL